MISLARRITIGTVALTVVVVGLATASAWMAVRWQSLRVLDGEVREHTGRLRGMLERREPPPRPWSEDDDDPGPGSGPDGFPPEMRAGTGWVYVVVVDAHGRERFRTPTIEGPAAAFLEQVPAAAQGEPRWMRWKGRPLQAMAVEARRSHDGLVVRGAVAVDASATLAELDRLALTLLAVWVIASLLALLAAWWLRRAVIGPLQALGRGIRAIDPQRLDRRVPVDGPVEVAEATRLLNALLEQIQGLVEREKGAIANMAHELRTPISGLRTTLEVATLGGDAGSIALAERCLPTVVAMHGLVANLLTLARLESGRETVRLQPVELAAAVAASWAVLAPLADGRRVRLEGAPAGERVASCPERLAMTLGNLLANAVEHAPEGSLITLECHSAEARVRLRIANRFTGPAPDPQRVFEPFWRGDAARTSPSHCGLGLPLARRLASLLGATLEVTVAEGVFTAELGMPVAGA